MSSSHILPQQYTTNNPTDEQLIKIPVRVLRVDNGVHWLTMEGRPATLVALEGELRWAGPDWPRCYPPGPLVDSIDVLFAVRNELGLGWLCLRRNFAAVLGAAAEVAHV